MKTLLISFVVGLLVGAVYGLIRVKSPAPPIVALLGLLGMVIGEHAGGWLLSKKTQAGSATRVKRHNAMTRAGRFGSGQI